MTQLKYIKLIFLLLVYSVLLFGQKYDYTFSHFQKKYLHGFVPTINGLSNPELVVSPQNVARDLMTNSLLDEVYNVRKFAMKIESISGPSSNLIVTTTGSRYQFQNSSIVCYQRNTQPLGSDRIVTTISFANFLFNSASVIAGGVNNGSVSLELISSEENSSISNSKKRSTLKALPPPPSYPKITLRITGDGILMIYNTTGNTLALFSNLNFYPGYIGVGEPVSCDAFLYSTNNIMQPVKSEILKTDFSQLFLDNYGGFGVYLANNYTSMSYDFSGLFPEYDYEVTSNDVIWFSVSPPRAYDWNLTDKILFHYGSSNEDNTDQNKEEQTIHDIYNYKTDVDTTKIDPYPILNHYRNWKTQGFSSVVLNVGAEPIQYDNWQLSYKPRHFTNHNIYGSENNWWFMDKTIRNAHSFGMEILFYTCPAQYLNGSSYNSPEDGYYHGRYSDLPSNYFKNITNHYIRWTLGISDSPGNQEGANINDYLNSVNQLISRSDPETNEKIDGIYVDGLYGLNIPQSYILMRKLRGILQNKKIFLHVTPRPGNDGYLPQTETYADYVISGENRMDNFYKPPTVQDNKYLRYFISSYNISNSKAYLLGPWGVDEINGLTIPPYLVTAADTFNLNAYGRQYHQKNYLDNNMLNTIQSMWSRDSSKILPKFRTYISKEQPKYQNEYQNNRNIDVTQDKFFSGDFNGDGKTDVLRVNTRNWNWYVRLSNGKYFEEETKWWNSWSIKPQSKVLVGDFNGDGKDDVVNINYGSPQNYGCWSWEVLLSNNTSFIWDNHALSGHAGYDGWRWQEWGVNDFLGVGDFNFDGYDDILMVNDSNPTGVSDWKVSLSSYSGTSTGSFSNPSIWKSNWIYNPSTMRIITTNINGNNNNIGKIAHNDDVLKLTNDGIWWGMESTGDPVSGFYTIYNRVSFNNYMPAQTNWAWDTSDLVFAGNFYVNSDIIGNTPKTDIMRIKDEAVMPSDPNTRYFDIGVNDNSGGHLFNYHFGWTSPVNGWINSSDKILIGRFAGNPGTDVLRIEALTGAFYVYKNIPVNSASGIAFERGENWGKGFGKRRHGDQENNKNSPSSFYLAQNYPNPFNPSTKILYSIPNISTVKIVVYDRLGREIVTLVEGEHQPGYYSVDFNASTLSSGVYFYKIQSGNYINTKKMLFLK